MTASPPNNRPRKDPWTVSIHDGPTGERTLGSGVVIDGTRVLTCHHVVAKQDSAVWVAFPKAGVPRSLRRRVTEVRAAADADVAVLELVERVPEAVIPAPLLCPDGTDLVDEPWWAFGFPEDVPKGLGSDAWGSVGATLGYGWVRLETDSRYVVSKGFSGTGLWSPRYQAIVGLVGQARTSGERRGDALAITLSQADRELPGEKISGLAAWSIATAGESALAAWGWSLETDAEAGRHWRPRARGVSVDTEAGYRFRGRRTALTEIVDWLDRPDTDDRILVITGSPGVGKSAVLGRVVTTADMGIRAALPANDDNVKASVGSVGCAVHVKGKTALDVAVEIARAASVRLPVRVSDLESVLRKRFTARPEGRLNLVIDALDEANTPLEARQIIDEIVLPLARHCGKLGVQVVIGTRRADDGGDLLTRFGSGRTVIDLDDEKYFQVNDLAAYATATLQLIGAERHDNPYADDAVAEPVAVRIAELAERNFLVAGLVARRHGLYDKTPVDTAEMTFPPDVDTALAAYVRPLNPVGSAPAELVLTALAYAQAPGLSPALWRCFLSALGEQVRLDDLETFARSSAANFLVEVTTDGQGKRFRLFHQALNDALLRHRDRAAAQDQAAIADALMSLGGSTGWRKADPYLLRSLPYHAHAGGVIDDVLANEEFQLHGDLLRLTALAADATTEAGRQRAHLLRLTPGAATVGADERAAMMSVTAVLEGVKTDVAAGRAAPYRGLWATAGRRSEWTVLEGHKAGVAALCTVQVGNRTLLVSADVEGTLKLWNPETSQAEREVAGLAKQVLTLRPTVSNDHALLVVGAQNSILALDPESGHPHQLLNGNALRPPCCVVPAGERVLLAGCDADGILTLWDPVTRQKRELVGHVGDVLALCPVVTGGETLLASAGYDRTVRFWDVEKGVERRRRDDHDRKVAALCTVSVPGHIVLASASADGTIRLWHPASGQEIDRWQHHFTVVNAMCEVRVGGNTLLAVAGDGEELRLFDPTNGRPMGELAGHTGPIRDVCTVPVGDRPLLATASEDGTVRLWDPAAGERQDSEPPRAGSLREALTIKVQGRTHLAVGAHDGTVRFRDGHTGRQLPDIIGRVDAMCCFPTDDGVHLALARSDGTVVDWDPATRQRRDLGARLRYYPFVIGPTFVGQQPGLAVLGRDLTLHTWQHQAGWQRHSTVRQRLRTRLFPERYFGGFREHTVAACFVAVGRNGMLASADNLGNIRLWEVESGRLAFVLPGNRPVHRIIPLPATGRDLVASSSTDGRVRIWDPRSGTLQHELIAYTGEAHGICGATIDGRTVLITAGEDRIVRVWDPLNGTVLMTVPVHHAVYHCAAQDGLVVFQFRTGFLAIEFG
ncbi:trypsin-like peptidase domain-containing protein [Actinoplanes sp. LDG1-06]|uniref:Trypsin-like peptidase domain-containing protein n=1 Tax=Paractinoplanes ovalisporus TaxID=2810368 RepID=A0ABS2ATD1_9ACTN|nr:trypsin-like peptidase domain-containing protein [Actinoplanes ovalisporus]MBM2623112.1 trypsin-like peptidase domain-containing protein [Actinoplanes ovalisporus]